MDVSDIAETVADATNLIEDVDDMKNEVQQDFEKKTQGIVAKPHKQSKFVRNLILSVSILILLGVGIESVLPEKTTTS